jgi:hypothetical protein
MAALMHKWTLLQHSHLVYKPQISHKMTFFNKFWNSSLIIVTWAPSALLQIFWHNSRDTVIPHTLTQSHLDPLLQGACLTIQQKCIARHFHKCAPVLHSFSPQLFQKFVNLVISPRDHSLFEQTTLWASTFHHSSPEKKTVSIHCKRQTRAASVQGKMRVNLNTSTKSMQNKTYHCNSVHHFTMASIYPPFLAHPSHQKTSSFKNTCKNNFIASSLNKYMKQPCHSTGSTVTENTMLVT